MKNSFLQFLINSPRPESRLSGSAIEKAGVFLAFCFEIRDTLLLIYIEFSKNALA